MRTATFRSLCPCVIPVTAALVIGATTAAAQQITHGPILGRPGATEVGVWARTSRPGEFRVRYGTSADALDQVTPPVATVLEHDNTGWAHVTGLRPGTTYYYRVVTGTAQTRPRTALAGSFRTLPTADQYRHPRHNPDGPFNFSFEYACGNRQRDAGAEPTFSTMLDRLEGRIDFAILNGDFIYEQRRGYAVSEWLDQVGQPSGIVPRIVDLAPTIVATLRSRSVLWWDPPHAVVCHGSSHSHDPRRSDSMPEATTHVRRRTPSRP